MNEADDKDKFTTAGEPLINHVGWFYLTGFMWMMFRFGEASLWWGLWELACFEGLVALVITKANERIKTVNRLFALSVMKLAEARLKKELADNQVEVLQHQLHVLNSNYDKLREMMGMRHKSSPQPPPQPSRPKSRPPTADMALFNLGWGFTEEQLKAAFRAKAKQHHPERGGDAREFQKYVEAKDRLARGMVHSE